MPAVITKGTNYTNGATVNSTNLHAHIESATIAGVDRENVDRTVATPVSNQSAAPAVPASNECWQSSVTEQVAAYVSASTAWKPALAFVRGFTVNASSATVEAGHLLEIESDGTVSVATGGVGANNVVGVAAWPAAPGEAVGVVMHGPARMKITGTVLATDPLRLSATAGTAEAVGSAGSGAGPATIGVAITSGSGGYVWGTIRR